MHTSCTHETNALSQCIRMHAVAKLSVQNLCRLVSALCRLLASLILHLLLSLLATPCSVGMGVFAVTTPRWN